ncbi:MAG: SprT family zinc-dependent metalloprotease [Candidatus Krumholzibacteriia bacterium]
MPRPPARRSERHDVALVEGRPIRYRVRRSPRARHSRITVSRREGVVVTIPRRAPLAEAGAVIAALATWLAREVDRHGVAGGPVHAAYASGSELMVLGRPRRLELRHLPPDRKRARADLEDDRLRMELPGADLLDPRPALERFLRAFAGRHLRERVGVLADRIGLEPQRVIVGERRSRWGSCSGRGTLSFCYRLVMAPPEVVDAVVAHEICHLRHLNHGPRFKRLVRLACPEHDACMAWLREHGELLEV